MPAHADKRGDHTVAHGQALDAIAHGHNMARTLVPEHHGQRQGDDALGGRQVTVADAARLHLDHDFTLAGCVNPDVFNGDVACVVAGNGGA